ncbi:hypothetical protein [Neisseria leonii]|nr:hypothetical protein [Neisseria sp. 3986]MDD9325871.1 hypothetical protein [Neisseria sp. 3986]
MVILAKKTGRLIMAQSALRIKRRFSCAPLSDGLRRGGRLKRSRVF